jgi:hypothetical protein
MACDSVDGQINVKYRRFGTSEREDADLTEGAYLDSNRC